MWSARIIHEASLWEYQRGNCFITLTYDNGHIRPDWSLTRRDFQLFMKRLRKKENRHRHDPIRYFHCGEYGDVCRHRRLTSECERCHLGRPHYHAIIFNHDFRDREIIGQRGEHTHYTSGTLTDLWGNGHTQVGTVTADSAGYVARYNLKKVTGVKQRDWYRWEADNGELVQIEPEYCTMSRRPGIGKGWFDKYKSDVYPSDEVPIQGKGVVKGVPRYYDKLLEEEDPLLLESIKQDRQAFRAEHLDEYTPERLFAKYRVKQASIQTLNRELSE